MKKFFALFAIVALAMVGCKKNPDNQGNSGGATAIDGQWHLVEWGGEAPEFEVYLDFNKGELKIYQQVWSLDYELFEGTYKVSGEILTGTYADGSKWKSGYKFSVNGDKLTMYSQEDISITSIYEKCEIPESVIVETTATRSSEVVPFL